MATIQKHDTTDRVIYSITGDANADPPVPDYQIIVYKESDYHVEVIADWATVSAGAYTTWSEFAAALEGDNTIEIV